MFLIKNITAVEKINLKLNLGKKQRKKHKNILISFQICQKSFRIMGRRLHGDNSNVLLTKQRYFVIKQNH
ncbi:unnamed protein product [Meloidogyne enterolobii]|uniref:Uncharacterized protein n=1 Tax=Meloidogyne enterolobii TaxID=390850 RepID=A0ACB0ZSS5_MELEN